MVVDFRRSKTDTRLVSIMHEDVDIADNYKYLGVYVNNRLDWMNHTDVVYEKERSRPYSSTTRLLRQCLQQNAGDLQAVCGVECHPCCLLREQWHCHGL